MQTADDRPSTCPLQSPHWRPWRPRRKRVDNGRSLDQLNRPARGDQFGTQQTLRRRCAVKQIKPKTTRNAFWNVHNMRSQRIKTMRREHELRRRTAAVKGYKSCSATVMSTQILGAIGSTVATIRVPAATISSDIDARRSAVSHHTRVIEALYSRRPRLVCTPELAGAARRPAPDLTRAVLGAGGG